MKKTLATVLFIIVLTLLCTSGIADTARGDDINYDHSNDESSQEIFFPDLMVSFMVPEDMAALEAKNEGYYYANAEGSHAFVFYASQLGSLEEAEDSESIFGADLTAYTFHINGLNAVDYWYLSSENDTALYCVRAFIDNGYGQIVEFYEVCTDKDEQGSLESRIGAQAAAGETESTVETEGTLEGTVEAEDDAAEDTAGAFSESTEETDPEESAAIPVEITVTDSSALIWDTPSTGIGTGVCTGRQVNVRIAPKSGAKSLGRLNEGDTLTVLETDGEWSLVVCSFGQGYMKTQYIKLDDAQ